MQKAVVFITFFNKLPENPVQGKAGEPLSKIKSPDVISGTYPTLWECFKQ